MSTGHSYLIVRVLPNLSKNKKPDVRRTPGFLVRRKGLETLWCCRRLAVGKQQSTGLLHLIVRVLPSLTKNKKPDTRLGIWFIGTPKGTRTPDLLIRSQSLYPTELSAHVLTTCIY